MSFGNGRRQARRWRELLGCADDLENRRTGGWFLVYNGGWLFGCWLFFAVTGTSWKELYYADVANYPKTGLYG
jgi:hypothetical protein